MLSFAVVCEAAPDQRTGCDLADRVVCDTVRWIEEQLLDAIRQWRGLAPADPCLLWRQVPDLARQRAIRAQGHFEGEPGALDAAAARRALVLLHSADVRPDGVVLLRDDDGIGHRRRGLEQARTFVKIGVPIVIGLARTKRECWVLAGFDPQNAQEQQRLEQVKQRLGFDPRTRAEKLTAHSTPGAKRDAKQVLDDLTGGDHDRQADCWRKADLAILESRGRSCGLTDYLSQVRRYLVPLFEGRLDSP